LYVHWGVSGVIGSCVKPRE